MTDNSDLPESWGGIASFPTLSTPLDGIFPLSSPLSSVDTVPPSADEADSVIDRDFLFHGSDDDDIAASDVEYTITSNSKRRKRCASSTVVSVSVRARVIRTSGEKCWLCGMIGKHVAHVIAKSDRVMFHEFTQQGLLHMDSLHVIENLILLCPGCHGSFDERVPIWAFLPVDLASFIKREESFQNRRRYYAEHGEPFQRPDPWDDRTPNLPYRRYQIRLGHLLPGVFAQPVKSWHGNPIAAILRSQSIVSGITRLDPDTQCGLPDDVALQLQRLLFLYSLPVPKLVKQEQPRSILGPINPPADHEDPSPTESRCSSTGQPPQSHPEPKQGDARDDQHSQIGQHQQQQHIQNAIMTPPGSNTQQRGTEDRRLQKGKSAPTEPKWMFGPRMTANRILQWQRDTSSNVEQEG